MVDRSFLFMPTWDACGATLLLLVFVLCSSSLSQFAATPKSCDSASVTTTGASRSAMKKADANMTYTSSGSGNWSTMTWIPTGVPGASDSIVIATGHKVTIDQDVEVGQVRVNGWLTFDDTATPRTLTVNGTFFVAYRFAHALGNQKAHTLILKGDLINVGEFITMRWDSRTPFVKVIFAKQGDQYVSGSGLFFLWGIVLDKGSIDNRVVCSSSMTTYADGKPNIEFISGTWQQTAGNLELGRREQAVGVQTIPSGAALILSDSSSMSFSGDSLVVQGGTLAVETKGELLLFPSFSAVQKTNVIVRSGLASLKRGLLNIYGAIILCGGTTLLQGMDVNMFTNTSWDWQEFHVFEISGSANVQFESGTVSIVGALPLEWNLQSLRIGPTVGNVDLTGGTFRFGDGTDNTYYGFIGPTAYVIRNETQPLVPIGNLIVQTGKSEGNRLVLKSKFQVQDTLTLLNSDLDVGSWEMIMGIDGVVAATNGYVKGALVKSLSTTSPKTYEVGTANGYSPVVVTVRSGAGVLGIKAVEGFHGGIADTSITLKRYWTIQSDSITEADFRFSYLADDVRGNETNYCAARYSGGGTSWDFFAGVIDSVSHEVFIQNVQLFGDFGVGEILGLPVELVGFSASRVESGIALHWRTATESMCLGFEIEKRAIGEPNQIPSGWTTLGFVRGSGTSSFPVDYSFLDATIQNGRFAYRLRKIDQDGSFDYSSAVEIAVDIVPLAISLSQNYPNPFNPSTAIRFDLPIRSSVTLTVYDLLGKEVEVLAKGDYPEGVHAATWNATGLPSGVYLCVLRAGAYTAMKRLVLVR